MVLVVVLAISKKRLHFGMGKKIKSQAMLSLQERVFFGQ